MCIITNSLNSRRLPSIIIIIAVETLVSLLLSGPSRFSRNLWSEVSMRPLVLLLFFLAVVGGQDIREVDNHNALFHAISNAFSFGNNIVPHGAIVLAAQGTYIGAPYAEWDNVYRIEDIYFSLICSSSPHSCILDGADSHRIKYTIRDKFSNTNHCWHDF